MGGKGWDRRNSAATADPSHLLLLQCSGILENMDFLCFTRSSAEARVSGKEKTKTKQYVGKKVSLGGNQSPSFILRCNCVLSEVVNFEFITGRLLLCNKELQNLLTRYNKHLLFSSLAVGWLGCLSPYIISPALGQLSCSLWSWGSRIWGDLAYMSGHWPIG